MCCKNCNKWGCKGSCVPNIVAKILVIIGGIKWGLIGLGMLLDKTNWNAVNMLLGSMPLIEAIVYLLVGVSATVVIFGCKCKKCKEVCASCEEKKEEVKM